MKMEIRDFEINKDNTVQLGSLKGGDVFRFAHLSYADAIKEDAFYTVLDAPEKQGVLIANPKDGKCLLRDKEHRVVRHNAVLNVSA
jgi:hypothetical protein